MATLLASVSMVVQNIDRKKMLNYSERRKKIQFIGEKAFNLYRREKQKLYFYVHNNPVNFNDPSGHFGTAMNTSPSYMVNTTSASWMNWGAYSSLYGNLYGGNIGFGGGVPGGGGGSQSGYWQPVYGQAAYTSGGEAVWDTELGAWVGPEMTITSQIVGWQFVTEMSGGVNGVNQSTDQVTVMMAQPMPQTYMMAMPPSKFHLDRFFYLNANPEGMMNTLALVTMATTAGAFWGSRTGHPAGVLVGAEIGMWVGFFVVEAEYVALSIYPEGWAPPREPSPPPPGLGSYNQQKFNLPPLGR